MVEIKVKAVNKDYFVVCQADDSFLMLEELEKKLCACSHHGDQMFKAFFVFHCPINETLLIMILIVCQKNNTLFLGVKETDKEPVLQVFRQKIYAGDKITFYENTLISHDIPQDSFIIAYANLYVLGNISGCVDLIHPDCECKATSFKKAQIRIFDSIYQNVTFFSPITLYYENQKILVK